MNLPGWARGEVRASTAVPVITGFLAEPGPGAQLVVSTYHSAPCVAAALRRAGKVPDLLVCDEAHHLVDAAPARGKVRILRGQGVSQKAIARAAGLNVKTVAELEDAVLARVRPETEQGILSLTVSQVRQFEKAGRWGGTEPAAPVLRLVDEMTALGWLKAWIAREIGEQRALQLGKGAAVSTASARKIRDLRQRVGSLTAPPRSRRQELPPLAEITASLAAAS